MCKHLCQALMSCCGDLTSRTKKSLIEDERRKPHVKMARNHWFRWKLPATLQAPHRVVFIDETSVKTNMTRLRGRSKCGIRLNASAPFGAWGTQTFIAGLTDDQLIAPWVIKGAMTGKRLQRISGRSWCSRSSRELS